MDHVWSPWRFPYVSTAMKKSACIFCEAINSTNAYETLVLYRGRDNFVILNLYPYNNGHLMIAPYGHISNPADAAPEIAEEMIRLTQRSLSALKAVYHPDGFNIGMNLGKCAGAGVEDHYHLHVVPRWNGDTNFMTTIGETRVLPEDFHVTIAKLKPYFEEKQESEKKK
jgi:ATP adenylyltransferase